MHDDMAIERQAWFRTVFERCIVCPARPALFVHDASVLVNDFGNVAFSPDAVRVRDTPNGMI